VVVGLLVGSVLMRPEGPANNGQLSNGGMMDGVLGAWHRLTAFQLMLVNAQAAGHGKHSVEEGTA
jgi:hypothetical protein